MKKYLTLLLILIGLMGTSIFAQTIVPSTPSAVREGDFAFVKKLKAVGNGLAMDINGDAETVSMMLKERLEEATREKVKSFKKGILGVEGVVLEAISGNTYDYYYRVDEKKGSSPASSTITFFASVGNYNFMDSGKYPSEIDATKIWLQKLYAWKRLKEISVEEASQQTKLAAAEKKGKEMEEELAKLQEKIKNLNSKLEENKKAISKQEEAQKKHKNTVEEIRAQLQKLLNEKTSLQN
jgi:valyl-tRNA synthetase